MTTQRLVQLGFDVLDALGDEIVGNLALGGLPEDLLRRRNGGIGGGGAHVGERLRLGLGDLGLGDRGAPRDQLFQPRMRLVGDALGFGLRIADDGLSFAFGIPLPAPIFREQFLRVLAQPPRLVELTLDLVAALIERGEDHAMRPDVAEQRHEHEEGDADPELGFEHGYPSSASSTAALTAESAGTAPISRSTIAAAASTAIACTLAMAADLVAAMVRSAAASLALSSDSSVLRRSSASALSRWLASSAMLCARPRASASAFSYAARATSDWFLSSCASARSPLMRSRRA